MKTRPTAGLFMDMGLGKTPVALHAMLDMPKPILLVAPIRVLESVWMQEAALWPATRGLTFSKLRGTPVEREQARGVSADVYLVNPELMQEALLSPRLNGLKSLVIDESSLFKNASTKRFRVLRKHLPRFTRRLILTGTPTPNSLLELWSQIFILDRGERLERSFSSYRSRYFVQQDYFGYVFAPAPGAKEKVTNLISDLVLRVDAESHLPPRSVLHNKVFFKLPPGAAKTYKEFERHAMTIINDKLVTAPMAAAALMKLRQLASGFVYADDHSAEEIHTEKLKAVEEITQETGSPVLLVYQFQHELAAIKKAFPHAVPFTADKVEAWNRGEIPLMLIHPASGGYGVNLQQGGHTMIVFSGSFSQEQMSQTFARIDRQGQEHPVIFHHLMAGGTVDELLFDVIQEKTANQTHLLNRIKEYAQAHSS